MGELVMKNRKRLLKTVGLLTAATVKAAILLLLRYSKEHTVLPIIQEG